MTTSTGAPAGALRVVDPVGNPAAGGPANRTVSEGIGYGMLLAVYFADKTVFDPLWAYATAHMSNGLMSWQIDATGALVNGDTHSATDADEDMAWALLMADKQWGGTYLAAATTLIKAIKANEVGGTTLQGGDFTGGPIYYDYAAPAYYPVFASASGDASWNQVLTGEYNQLIGVQNGTTGLMPDSNQSSSFGYDAVRAPWRIGIDYCWHGTAQAQTFLGPKLVPFLVNFAASNGGPSSLKLAISLTGTMGTDTSGTLAGPAAVGAMMSASDQAFIDSSWTYLANTIVPETSSASAIGPNYFSSTLGMLGLVMLSGNFVDYTNPPQ
jgi:endoglucanase